MPQGVPQEGGCPRTCRRADTHTQAHVHSTFTHSRPASLLSLTLLCLAAPHAGNLGLLLAMLRSCPQLATQPNKDGLLPMHLAAMQVSACTRMA